MLTIHPDALAYIQARARPVFLELPAVVRGCFDFQEAPSVRLGEPHDPHAYEARVVDGAAVWVPRRLPEGVALEIRLSRLFGFRWLVVEGWRYL
jgi:hypothetical protein